MRRFRPVLLALLALTLLTNTSLAGQDAAQEVAKESPFRFAVIGDTGTGEAPQRDVAHQMSIAHAATPFEHVLMNGDNIYGGKFAKIDAVFNIPYRTLLSRGVKFHATLGNHDIRCEKEQMSFEPFNMGGKRNYSFKPSEDLVEFFTIDSTAIEEGRELEQLNWLDKALADSKARWKIAWMHHSPYSPGSRHGDDPLIIAKIVSILKKNKARVVFTGHEHFFAKIATRDGIDYVISGSGGKIHRKAIDRKYPGLEAANDSEHHFVLCELTNDELTWKAIGLTGATLGQGVIPFEPKK